MLHGLRLRLASTRLLPIAIVSAVLAVSAQTPQVTLTGLATLPADTFAAGPPSGAWLRADALGTPQFPSQPVQGVSSLWPAGEQRIGSRSPTTVLAPR